MVEVIRFGGAGGVPLGIVDAAPISIVPVEIPAGPAVLSEAVKTDGKQIIGIVMSAEWTTALISFVGSFDGVTFVDIGGDKFDDQSPTASVTAGWYIALSNPGFFRGFTYIKLRSGDAFEPVPQDEARQLQLVLAG